MEYKIKAFLPSLNRHVFAKEISFKVYRNIVKSLYTPNNTKIIEQFNLVVEDLVPGITEEGATIAD